MAFLLLPLAESAQQVPETRFQPVTEMQPQPVAEQRQPIPPAAVPSQSDQVISLAREMLLLMERTTAAREIENRLPETIRRTDELTVRTEATLAGRATLSLLHDLGNQWTVEISQVKELRKEVGENSIALAEQLARMKREIALWNLTAEQARKDLAPDALLDRIAATLGTLNDTQRRLKERQDGLLALENKLADLQARLELKLQAVVAASRESLMTYDARPLWSVLFQGQTDEELISNLRNSLTTSHTSLEKYLREETHRVVAQFVLWVGIVLFLSLLRRRARPWIEEDRSLETTAQVLGRPFSAALLVALIATSWFHPQAPREFQSLAFLLFLLPIFRLLPSLFGAKFRSGIYLLTGLFLLQRLVMLLSYSTLPGRLLLLLLTVLVGSSLAVFLSYLTKKALPYAVPSTLSGLAKIAIAVTAVSILSNTIGNVSLASLLTEGILHSMYLAVWLQALCLIFPGILAVLLKTDFLRRLRMVSLRGPFVEQRLSRGLVWLAWVVWVVETLNGFSALLPFVRFLRSVLSASLKVGHWGMSLGDLLAFLLILYVSILVSRFLRFVLEEEAYPRVSMGRGIPGTISRLTTYSVLTLGFFVAISAAGFGLDRLTVLWGALGVGVGFGLQDVVKNFVCGLILLFERPLKIGDQIQLGDVTGVVKEIGIRASTVRTWEGADVIVPNANLITGQVINWTPADQLRRVEIKVGVACGTDSQQVLDLLLRVGREHPDLLKEPEPVALFLGSGQSSLDFTLRGWTQRIERFPFIQSELTQAVHAALRQTGIEIPFPQQDIHVRSIDDKVRSLLHGKD